MLVLEDFAFFSLSNHRRPVQSLQIADNELNPSGERATPQETLSVSGGGLFSPRIFYSSSTPVS
jgi:hypothetical protein